MENETKKEKIQVPVSEKFMLTLEETAAYTGVGMQKLREISADEHCDFILWIGRKRMFKRKKLEEHLAKKYPEDRSAYINGKSAFIEKILLMAAKWRKR